MSKTKWSNHSWREYGQRCQGVGGKGSAKVMGCAVACCSAPAVWLLESPAKDDVHSNRGHWRRTARTPGFFWKTQGNEGGTKDIGLEGVRGEDVPASWRVHLKRVVKASALQNSWHATSNHRQIGQQQWVLETTGSKTQNETSYLRT